MRNMRYALPVLLLLTLSACGGSPTGPTPQPAPTPIHAPIPAPAPTFTGTVTNTVTGGPVKDVTATISGGRLIVSAPGYVTRETAAGASTVDLIPEQGFDLGFYRQFARGQLETGTLTGLRVLSASPFIYMQTAGLQAATVEAYRAAAANVIPALTGNRLQLAGWETGNTARPEQAGWIVVDLMNDPAVNCGRANVGTVAGHVWMNMADRCHRNGDIVPSANAFAHEIGHTLGFTHVDTPGALMTAITTTAIPSAAERHHGAIAYRRPRGNRDLDVDP